MEARAARDLKVLLVEDFEDTRLVMRLQLEDKGFIVFEAENGQVAVETAIREKPDVILMGTGSEVSLCVDAYEQLTKDGIKARVVR